MNPKTPATVWILDDDASFRDNVRTVLEEAGFAVTSTAPTESALRQLIATPPEHLLLDQNLGEWPAERWLEWLQKEGMNFDPTRIWLVSGMESVPIEAIRARFPAVQHSWLGKPLRKEELIAKLRQAGQHDFPSWMAALPAPLRIIDTADAVIYTNQFWKLAANRPDPKDTRVGKASPVYWGPYPSAPEDFGDYRLHTWQLEEYPGWRLQTEERVAVTPTTTPKVKDLIRRAFATMREAGFPRGRFYRIHPVPNSSNQTPGRVCGLLSLELADGKYMNKVGKHPIYGEIQKILEGFRQETKPDKLVYAIRRKADAPSDDAGIQYWNQKVSAHDLDSWVEIPVLRKVSNGSYHPYALFVFDRLGAEGLLDGEVCEVSEHQVKKVEKTLRHLIDQAIELRKKEETEQQLAWLDKLDKLEAELGKQGGDRQKLENSLLIQAQRLSGATSGVLALRHPSGGYLEVGASLGALVMKGLRFPMSAGHFSMVKCAQELKALFIPDYKKLPENERITEENWKILDIGRASELHDWLETQVSSVIALPIHYGDIPLGVMVLQSRKPLFFTEHKVARLQQLLNRARWYLHAASQVEQRKMWEYALMHELRSDIKVIRDNANELREGNFVSSGGCIYHGRIERFTLSLLDMSNDFLTVQRSSQESREEKPFATAGEIVSSSLALWEEDTKRKSQNIEVIPNLIGQVWRSVLRGPEEYFSRVVRNLLDNALRYGGKNAVVRIKARIVSTQWILEVENPGQMSAEEDQIKFAAFQKPAKVTHDGAHIGLASSKRLVESVGGKLELDNLPEESKVRAHLCWPLA